MEYIFEFILDLALGGCYEASKCEKIPKAVRYLLIGLIVLFFLAVIGLIFFTAIIALKINIVVGILLLLLAAYLLVSSIIKFRNTYFKTRK